MSEIEKEAQGIDRSYMHAVDLLDDQEGRAARRRQVLAAVSKVERKTPARWSGPARGGWLVVAGIAGVSVVVSLLSQVETGRQEAGAASADKVVVAQGPAAEPRAAAAAPEVQAEAIARQGGASRASAADAGKAARAQSKGDGITAMTQGQKARRQEAQRSESGAAASEDGAGETVVAAAPAAQARANAIPGGAGDGRQSEVEADANAGQPAAEAAPRTAIGANQDGAKSGRSAARAQGFAKSGDLGAAVASGSEENVKIVLASGAKLEVRDSDGDTPLLKAVRLGKVDVAALLLREGADRQAQGKDGKSAREVARVSDDFKMRQLFKD